MVLDVSPKREDNTRPAQLLVHCAITPGRGDNSPDCRLFRPFKSPRLAPHDAGICFTAERENLFSGAERAAGQGPGIAKQCAQFFTKIAQVQIPANEGIYNPTTQ